MAGTVQELRNLFVSEDALAGEIGTLYSDWRINRKKKEGEMSELRNYLFATDTTSTSNVSDGYSNKTTIPKLTNIRDGLHANYLAAVLPNDNWLKWEGYTEDSATKDKRKTIQAYMDNKAREGGIREVVSKLLYDYIDDGNVFGEVGFENNSKEINEESVPQYIGPKLYRISPFDIVFNIAAPTFESSPKIIRYLKSIGELIKDSDNGVLPFEEGVIDKLKKRRESLSSFSSEDVNKEAAYAVDGFGTYSQYIGSGYVEVLRFLGNIYDVSTDTYLSDQEIYVLDRQFIAYNETNPSWQGSAPIFHVGWRERPDNLWSMGPLDNLVGLQYRIDHLENLKADAFDQYIWPPIEVRGEFAPFVWGPNAIALNPDNNGQLVIHRPDASVLIVDNEISYLIQLMEEMAGFPKQALGIRTPGEKTAFEVSTLGSATDRLFQDKTTNFEINFFEKALNAMLGEAVEKLSGADLIRVMDDDLGVATFLEITKKDITATGKLRPIGARHFSEEAQRIQNLVQLSNTKIWDQIKPHISSKALAMTVEELLNFDRFDIFKENVAVFESAETAKLAETAAESVEVDAATPGTGGAVPLEEEVLA